MKSTKNSWPRELLWLLADGLLILLLALCFIGVRVNFTSSMPLGLYLLEAEQPQRSDLAAFCLPSGNPFFNVAGERQYLAAGVCPAGQQPLLKRLAGVPGDRVEMNEGGIVLNDRLLPGTKRPDHDSQGRALPDSFLKPGLIPAGFGLLLSDEHDGGFDGRHFGLIRLSSLYRVKPIILFGKKSSQAQGE